MTCQIALSVRIIVTLTGRVKHPKPDIASSPVKETSSFATITIPKAEVAIIHDGVIITPDSTTNSPTADVAASPVNGTPTFGIVGVPTAEVASKPVRPIT